MDAADATKEIANLNLTYLLLAQKLLRQDRAAAMLRLGIGADLADMLLAMSLADVVKLAGSNLVLCGFRLDELPLLRALVQDARERALQQPQLSIGLTGALKTAAAR